MSVLEHIRGDRRIAIKNIASLTKQYAVICVPHSWHLHGDFDNGWRPSLSELVVEIEEVGLRVIAAELLIDHRILPGLPDKRMQIIVLSKSPNL